MIQLLSTADFQLFPFDFFFSLVHSVLLDYLNECNDEDRTEMITAFSPFIPSLASTKDGVRSSMICFWNSIVKDRRVSESRFFYDPNNYSGGLTILIRYFIYRPLLKVSKNIWLSCASTNTVMYWSWQSSTQWTIQRRWRRPYSIFYSVKSNTLHRMNGEKRFQIHRNC